MRTTTKEFKNKVQEHIINSLGNPWDYENDQENENATTPEKLQNVVNEFFSWWNDYEQHRTPNKYNAFQDFLMCLPGCISVEFITYNQRQTLREWHEQTEAEAERWSDDQITKQYLYLIAREFDALCKKYNIIF